ncbi:hypothetical protein BVX97_00155 [bacterium E08(2017)]|nr:hypothetical protein BVX97_00155 [bacterium E08(2017)]
MRNGAHIKGFTMLEMLAALAIFSMVIVMMGNIYHQASIAWDSGSRKAQGAIEARVILANIAQELTQAVADGAALSLGQIADGTTKQNLTFVTMRERRDIVAGVHTNKRDTVRVTYQMQGDSLVREEKMIDGSTTYGVGASGGAAEDSYVVATNIANISFRTPPLASTPMSPHPEQRMPRWVTIRLEIGRKDDVSGVAAVSAGPDGVFGNLNDPDSDDVFTY